MDAVADIDDVVDRDAGVVGQVVDDLALQFGFECGAHRGVGKSREGVANDDDGADEGIDEPCADAPPDDRRGRSQGGIGWWW